MLWIRIGFNADPDPAFYLNVDPDTYPDPGSQTKADPGGSGSLSEFRVIKVKFLHENIIKVPVGNRSKNIHTKEPKPSLFVNFGQYPYSWIRIRIPNTNPDPKQPNECGSRWTGSGSTTLLLSNNIVLIL